MRYSIVKLRGTMSLHKDKDKDKGELKDIHKDIHKDQQHEGPSSRQSCVFSRSREKGREG